MKIAIVSPSLMRAGAETQAVDLCNGFATLGHEVHLCTFGPRLDQKARIESAVRFHHFPRKSRFDFAVAREIAWLIDERGIESILGVMQFSTMIAWMARIRSRSRPPVLAAIHTTINRGWKEELQDRLIYRQILRRLPAVIFVCESQRGHWVARYPELEATAEVVHNGVDPARFKRENFTQQAKELKARLTIPEDAFVFSCIAAFRPEKGHHLLLEAFSRLPGAPYLLLAGEGQCRPAVEADAYERGLQGRVIFLGSVADPRPVIVASDATILASTSVETFSMAMLESMALGVPMIAPRIGGLPEAIRHEETGLLYPIGDVDSLRDRMSRLLCEPTVAGQLGVSARDLVTRQFAVNEMIRKTEAILRRV